MFSAWQDHANIRRPDFEKMSKDTTARIDKRNKSIKHQTDIIIALRAKLAKGKTAH